MERKTKHLCVISFDALSSLDVDILRTLPNFAEFMDKASIAPKVRSVYPSLTYPAHTSMVTGTYPNKHGIINNTLLQPNRRSPDWFWQSKYIQGKTVYDLASEKGMTVAALLWPVTAGAKIQYNMPEIVANRPWQTQVLVSLLNGSPLLQLGLDFKYGKLRQGTKQPFLDDFTHQALLHTLKTKKPDLTLVHFTDLDSMRHYHGFASEQAQQALRRHDQRLGEMIETLKETDMYDNCTLMVLGDHSTLDEDKIIRLNVLLRKHEYMDISTKGRVLRYKAIAKSCDGSAYVYLAKNAKAALIPKIKELLNNFNQQYHCFDEILTSSEAEELGADPNCALMLEATKGFYFADDLDGAEVGPIEPELVGVVPHQTKGAHGYSPFKKDYATVFMAAGKGIKQNVAVSEMCLVDVGPTIASLLGLDLRDVDGRTLSEILAF